MTRFKIVALSALAVGATLLGGGFGGCILGNRLWSWADFAIAAAGAALLT